MTEDLLTTELGKKDKGVRHLQIIDIEIKDIVVDKETGETSKKAIFYCKTEKGGKPIKIGEAWTLNRKGDKKVQGLWVNLDDENKLISNSVLGKLLQRCQAGTLNDLIGESVTGYPDNNLYTVFSTFAMNEDDIDQIIMQNN